ncbi:MAG: adenylate/guanylate cyclase domain-containing protein [Nannocystaceae bacterium]
MSEARASAGDILVVDDTPANLRLLSELLSEQGYRVRPVTSGAQALRAAAASVPDLVLLDVHMSELDGYEVCRRLKADPRSADVPVIFLSALHEPLDKVQAFTAGGVDYVTKPFNVDEVLARIRTHLELRRLQVEVEAERAKSDALLHRVLPPVVAAALRDGQPFAARDFDRATVLFADVVGFTAIAAASRPLQVFELLHRLYTAFDRACERHGVYKVETTGDSYMIVGGISDLTAPGEAGGDANAVAAFALDMLAIVRAFEVRPGTPLKIRIGIHSGSVVGGVVGEKMPHFCLFGETVNMAARLEKASVPMQALISESTKELLDPARFVAHARGMMTLRGAGSAVGYFLGRRE